MLALLFSCLHIALYVARSNGDCTLGQTNLNSASPNPTAGLLIDFQNPASCSGHVTGWEVCYFNPTPYNRAETLRRGLEIRLQIWRSVLPRSLFQVGEYAASVSIPQVLQNFQCVRIPLLPRDYVNVEVGDVMGVALSRDATLPVVGNVNGQSQPTPQILRYLQSNLREVIIEPGQTLSNNVLHTTAIITAGISTSSPETTIVSTTSVATTTSAAATTVTGTATTVAGTGTEITVVRTATTVAGTGTERTATTVAGTGTATTVAGTGTATTVAGTGTATTVARTGTATTVAGTGTERTATTVAGTGTEITVARTATTVARTATTVAGTETATTVARTATSASTATARAPTAATREDTSGDIATAVAVTVASRSTVAGVATIGVLGELDTTGTLNGKESSSAVVLIATLFIVLFAVALATAIVVIWVKMKHAITNKRGRSHSRNNNNTYEGRPGPTIELAVTNRLNGLEMVEQQRVRVDNHYEEIETLGTENQYLAYESIDFSEEGKSSSQQQPVPEHSQTELALGLMNDTNADQDHPYTILSCDDADGHSHFSAIEYSHLSYNETNRYSQLRHK